MRTRTAPTRRFGSVETSHFWPQGSDGHHGKLNTSMVLVRRHLSWLIAACLACQLAGIAAAPVALCCKDMPTSDEDTECCTGLLPGQVCPMHHTTAGKRECRMRDACAPSDAALIALAGGVGVLPTATPTVSSFDLGDVHSNLASTAAFRAVRPEAPPPRS